MAKGPIACRWCTALATGTVSARDGRTTVPALPHCDDHWEDAYREVRKYDERTWKFLDQPTGLF